MNDSHGPHAGKGPQAWTRDDARLREDVSDRLMEDRLIDARGVEVLVDGAVVTLVGHVPGASDVAHAELLARATPGVEEVRNRLTVEPGERAVDRLGKPNPYDHYEGRWGRWVPPVST
ncbi:MAG: BON domain-containing protein [Phenylobacterium sp.]|uniref:BON domain-containing protein n=1 Tax=Phenylobacterium sp. TaxID=1871053 RepID=UPI001A3A9D7C|nr:BON domain-containing protein [Phenylobacterium sp.]MBL8556721.1 BON domain-containing protein [Phenylobacterium sp.]